MKACVRVEAEDKALYSVIEQNCERVDHDVTTHPKLPEEPRSYDESKRPDYGSAQEYIENTMKVP